MKWYSKYLSVYGKSPAEIDESIFAAIKQKMDSLQSEKPVVTLAVIAYNEETHLTSCLWSLSEIKTSIPVEIVVVDNNSKDRTADVIEKCGAKYLKETKQGPGFARKCALDNSKGTYYFTLDGDTMYPSCYVDKMMEKFADKNVVAASGNYLFFNDGTHSSIGLFLHGLLRDFYSWAMHFKRPELVARGAVFACRADLAKKEGIRTDIRRGEDGSLALALKKYGKVVFQRSRKSRAATGYGSAERDGGFIKMFLAQSKRILRNFGHFFTSADHYEDREDNLIK